MFLPSQFDYLHSHWLSGARAEAGGAEASCDLSCLVKSSRTLGPPGFSGDALCPESRQDQLNGNACRRRRSTGACASMLARVYVKNRYIRVLDYHVEESWGSARKKALWESTREIDTVEITAESTWIAQETDEEFRSRLTYAASVENIRFMSCLTCQFQNFSTFDSNFCMPEVPCPGLQ